jgi:endonuclease/exonuclease/phosphatase family metal-dependent hydrolase
MARAKGTRKRLLIKTILLTVNALAIFLLLVSYLASWVNPDRYWYVALFGLAYNYVLLLNILFLLFWLLFKWKLALFSLLAILAGFNHVSRHFQTGILRSSPAVEATLPPIRVVSYNVQNLVRQNIPYTKGIRDFGIREQIIEFLGRQDADVICLQEFLVDREGFMDLPRQFGERFGCPHFIYQNYSRFLRKIDGIIIFTRYPVIRDGSFTLDKKSFAVFCDLQAGTDTVRVYNIHLASIHFGQEDYRFMQELGQQKDQDVIRERSIGILYKLKKAFIRRGRQVDVVADHIRRSPYPVIVCGDFNDSPASYAYRKIAGNLRDAFMESGKGFGNSWAGEFLPSFRIDFILHDPRLGSRKFRTTHVGYSDHYPVSCEIIMDNKAAK